MESEERPTKRSIDPHEALASIHAARAGVLRDLNYPVGYDLAYGAVCGLLVAAQGMPQPWSAVGLVVVLVGLGLMVRWWRDTQGWWINGYSPRRARWVAIAVAVVLIGLIGVSLYGRFYGPWWLFIPTGLVGAVTAAVGGRVWTRVWRRELAEGV